MFMEATPPLQHQITTRYSMLSRYQKMVMGHGHMRVHPSTGSKVVHINFMPTAVRMSP